MGKGGSKLGFIDQIFERSKTQPSQQETSQPSQILGYSQNNNSTNCYSSNSSTNDSNNNADHDLNLTDAQLTNLFDDHSELSQLFTEIFAREVETSDGLSTLFRGNCPACRVMANCFRKFGATYLRSLLAPHIKPLAGQYSKTTHRINDGGKLRKSDTDSALNSSSSCSYRNRSKIINMRTTQSENINGDMLSTPYSEVSNHVRENYAEQNNSSSYSNSLHKMDISRTSDISYEIDSTRLDGQANIDVNQRNLLKLTKEILDSILSSASDFPPQISTMCISLRQVLNRKYPNTDLDLRAVRTVIFLRFINPAIVAPYEAGIVDIQPPPKTLRGLKLVSKILQNIANNVEFSKEEHMLPFNDFVRAQFQPMTLWVSRISSECEESLIASEPT